MKTIDRKGEVNVWMIIAIAFMILFLLTIAVLIWLVSIGLGIMDKEVECQVNICTNKGYSTYYYDEVSSVCYCTGEDGEGYQEFLK